MANPTQPRPEPFRAVLNSGQVIEADGSTVEDPATGAQVPAVLLRMTPARANVLSRVLDDWVHVALVFETPRSSEPAELALAWTLQAGAAALGDDQARRSQRAQPDPPSPAQRLTAVAVLRERQPRITPVQGIAVVDAAARWLRESSGEELAQALLQAACGDPITANFVYLALIEPPSSRDVRSDSGLRDGGLPGFPTRPGPVRHRAACRHPVAPPGAPPR